MGKITIFRDLLGLIKDKASLSKAALISNQNGFTLRLAVLRATTHSPPYPPPHHHVSALLLLGDSSRATASTLITALIDRLHRTGNCVVALKCLLIIHRIIKEGPFILQDQISIFPAAGGYNYLKLSSFQDGATVVTWALSAWVRWYGRYLETLLSTSRVLGYFFSSSSCIIVKENQQQRISSVLNSDLIKDVDSLVSLMEEICNIPDLLLVEGDVMVKDIMGLLSNDYLCAVDEVSSRLGELKERLGCLSLGDSVELVCAVKRLEDCKERMSVMRKPSAEMLWGLVEELKDGVGMFKVCKHDGKSLSWDKPEKTSESARYDRTGSLIW